MRISKALLLATGAVAAIIAQGSTKAADEPKPAQGIESHADAESLPQDQPERQTEVKKAEGTTRLVTAYNNVREQTDDTPCISADGTDICQRYRAGEKICAANWVPIGTRLRVQGYGDCTVADRMAPKNGEKVDVYLGQDVAAARAWGARRIEVLIIKP